MVQIVIRTPQQESPGEMKIIELQGDLQAKDCANLAGQFISDLHYTKKGQPILIIGHHILFGKVVDLDKPFAVLRKKDSDNNDLEELGVTPLEAEKSDDEKLYDAEYNVTAIIKQKIIFKTRPKPIIANVKKKV